MSSVKGNAVVGDCKGILQTSISAVGDCDVYEGRVLSLRYHRIDSLLQPLVFGFFYFLNLFIIFFLVLKAAG